MGSSQIILTAINLIIDEPISERLNIEKTVSIEVCRAIIQVDTEEYTRA
jgi:hypothetical protein